VSTVVASSLATALDSAHDNASALASTLGRASYLADTSARADTLALAHALASDLGHARLFAQSLDSARIGALYGVLAFADVRTRGLVEDFTHGRVNELLDSRAAARARSLADDLSRARGLADDLFRARGLADILARASNITFPSDAEADANRNEPQRGRIVVARSAGRLVAIAARLVPASHRSRYAEEFRCELWDQAEAGAGRWCQMLYAARQLARAPRLRAELQAPHRRRASL
jgi:hypothetical protein